MWDYGSLQYAYAKWRGGGGGGACLGSGVQMFLHAANPTTRCVLAVAASLSGPQSNPEVGGELATGSTWLFQGETRDDGDLVQLWRLSLQAGCRLSRAAAVHG
ncbi:hypothetical protein MN608_06048 [Microdochium nivale]|nr:hypothetical protein MN608_06048 [Microdochium nivale]